MRPQPVKPGPGQESVWDYPRPPRLEKVAERLRVEFGGRTILDTTGGYRVLETSHPPTYYMPIAEFEPGVLIPAGGGSFCEWKGAARYFDIVVGSHRAPRAAWGYPGAKGAFAAIADFVALYAGPMEACWVGDERASPQPGGFYGGWVTSKIVGPIKGEPGTMGW